MANLTTDDTKHVAHLAKLQLSDSEITKFTKQLAKIVNLMDELNEVDTSDVEPTAQTTGLENVLREDVIKPEYTLSQDEALSGSDKTKNGFFVVKQILKKD